MGSGAGHVRAALAVLLTLPVLAGFLLTGTAAAHAEAAPARVVVVGVPGLQWGDLDRTRTPNLWRLVERGASASMSTRAVPPPSRSLTCPVAGWLTVSAGQRAVAPPEGLLEALGVEPRWVGRNVWD
ncbi:hypothetical protein ACFQ08_44560, partial [Streptosporangium algeriense]